MRTLLFAATAAVSLLGASSALAAPMEPPAPRVIFGVDRPSDQPMLDRVQFIFGGRTFCWYDIGWQGPGFYWCGYAERRGFGWGGGAGWNGWRHGSLAGPSNRGSPGRSSGARVAASSRAASGASRTHDGAGAANRGGDSGHKPAA